ncbi:MAG TPA: thiamine phosphate synthase [Hanamia sp.]
MLSKLQYISQGITATEQLNNIQKAAGAGCNWIQLRFKNATTDEIRALAEEVKKICTDYTATFIINDHPQIANAVDADGVHLGLTDIDITEAKKIMGNSKIIGGTANTLEHVLQRVEEGCSYIGLGPLRFTTTKEKLSPILGLKGYKKIMDELEERQIQMPVYAIGGIVLEDIVSIMQTGVYGVAVSGIITNHPDKKLLVQQFNTHLYETVNHCR